MDALSPPPQVRRLDALLIPFLLVSLGVHLVILGFPYLVSRGTSRQLSAFEVQFSMLKDVVDTDRDKFEEIIKETAKSMEVTERDQGPFVWTQETFPDNIRLLGQAMGLMIKEVSIKSSSRGPHLDPQITLVSTPDRAVQEVLMAILMIGHGTNLIKPLTDLAVITVTEKDGPGDHRIELPTRFCRELLIGKSGLPDVVAQMRIS